MSAGSEVRCSFVVACPQGCSESSVVLNAIRYQLGAFDELIVVESVPCDSGIGRELHVPLGTNDEDIMLVEGAQKAVGDVVVVIEDHVVIGNGFVDALRKRFSDGVTEACTFAISYGTPRRIGARALFLFVSGLAGPSVEPALRERRETSLSSPTSAPILEMICKRNNGRVLKQASALWFRISLGPSHMVFRQSQMMED